MGDRLNESALAKLEIGRLNFQQLRFEPAIHALTSASVKFESLQLWEPLLDCKNILLRIFAERDDQPSVQAIRQSLEELGQKYGLKITARLKYTFGVAALLKGQNEESVSYFQDALQSALSQDRKEDMCYAISGLSIAFINMGKLPEALREVYNLQVFFEVLDLPDLKIATLLANAIVLRKLQRLDQALEVFQQAQELLRVRGNLYFQAHLNFSRALTLKQFGNVEAARYLFEGVYQMIHPSNLKTLYRDCEIELRDLGYIGSDEYDLLLDIANNFCLEKEKGRVEFKSQNILLDLMGMFAKNPGDILSKEIITQRLWGQRYDPEAHDNKIYVTIKRLRKLIEPDSDKPRYIFRAKSGYYLNKEVKVLCR